MALYPSLDPSTRSLARAAYLRRDDAQTEAVSVADSEAGLDVERDKCQALDAHIQPHLDLVQFRLDNIVPGCVRRHLECV